MEIVPLTGVTGAAFGQSRATVRVVRGGPDSAFRRGADAPLTDLYADESCVFFEYDDADLLHAIEIASPGPVSLHGVRLLGRPEDEVVGELRDAGHEVVAEEEAGSIGFSLPALGVTLGGTAQDTDGFESVRFRGVSTTQHAFEFFEGPDGLAGGGEPAVVPHQGIGPVRLGAGRGEMRRLLGGGIGSVPEFGAAFQDTFFCGVVLSYDVDGSVVRIAFTGRTSLGHGGVPLLGRPHGDVREQARDQGLRVVDREAELVFPDAGFSVLTARDGDGLPTTAVVLPAPVAAPGTAADGRRDGPPRVGLRAP
ncbi:hypothetical protein HW130_31415 [Streptomyces sp. PKU-EA00015]|uniref:hypothetical protein n=1 Tax=Streptomyces sp. PKU-EA00015 TaxID=2748326 RepID=UPI0015A07869|nr:hypothetical protein [Streptomyces sp. PKU-EA00015]NWF30703.1 hypothetical protein [Streptomyces sp. PKU-EA00015]